MNLQYAHKLLIAADEQRHGFIKLRGLQADHEVHLMAEAGLVDASYGEGEGGSFAAINRLTAAGQTFLRVFKDPVPKLCVVEHSVTPSARSVAVTRERIFDPDLEQFAVAV